MVGLIDAMDDMMQKWWASFTALFTSLKHHHIKKGKQNGRMALSNKICQDVTEFPS